MKLSGRIKKKGDAEGEGEEQHYLLDSFGRRQIEAADEGDEICEDMR